VLSREEFGLVVRHAPLVSIDLIVRDRQGRFHIGLRNNKPAQGTWFVLGGVIRKDERIAAAFKRITRAELGVERPITAGRFLNVFEHFYPDNALGEPGYGTHYVVLAYAIDISEELRLPDEQHARYRWATDAEVLADPAVHENTKAYCRA
jgi:colanic acid biosynthesis protein WcaH